MHDADRVCGAEAARGTEGDARGALPRHRRFAEVGGASADVLHDEIRHRCVEAELVDLDDVRMRERRDRHRFATEPAIRVGLATVEDLERYKTSEIAILGEIDLAHAARAERALDREAAD